MKRRTVLYLAAAVTALGVYLLVGSLIKTETAAQATVVQGKYAAAQATVVQGTYAAAQATVVQGTYAAAQATVVQGKYAATWPTIIVNENPLHILKERLLQILPITCHPGSEGLFPRKYDKLLQALAEYAVFHNRSGHEAHPLIYRCDQADGECGGLVDRLRGIVYTLLLAVFSRRRLLLHWGMPRGEHVYLKPNLINWVPEKSDTENMSVFTVMSVVSSNLDSAIKTIGMTTSVNVALHINLELELIKASKFKPQWLIDGLKRTGLDVLTNSEINAIFGIAFRYLFGFTSDVVREVNKAKFLLGLDTKYVAVHIRTGLIEKDYGHEKCVRKREQWERMLQCAASVANSNTGLNSSIFLPTDSNLVKNLARKTYGVRYRTLDVVLTHVDKIDKNGGPNEAENKGLLGMWVDFLLLAQSYIQVRSGGDWIRGSGFDLGAGHLCGLPRNQTFNGLKNCAKELKSTNDS